MNNDLKRKGLFFLPLLVLFAYATSHLYAQNEEDNSLEAIEEALLIDDENTEKVIGAGLDDEEAKEKLIELMEDNHAGNIAYVKKMHAKEIQMYKEEIVRLKKSIREMREEVAACDSSYPLAERKEQKSVSKKSHLQIDQEKNIRVKQSLVSRALLKAKETYASARFVKHFKNGMPVGYRIVGMKRDSPFAMLELQNGDILLLDAHMEKVEHGIYIFQLLKETGVAHYVINRNGRHVKYKSVVSN